MEAIASQRQKQFLPIQHHSGILSDKFICELRLAHAVHVCVILENLQDRQWHEQKGGIESAGELTLHGKKTRQEPKKANQDNQEYPGCGLRVLFLLDAAHCSQHHHHSHVHSTVCAVFICHPTGALHHISDVRIFKLSFESLSVCSEEHAVQERLFRCCSRVEMQVYPAASLTSYIRESLVVQSR